MLKINMCRKRANIKLTFFEMYILHVAEHFLTFWQELCCSEMGYSSNLQDPGFLQKFVCFCETCYEMRGSVPGPSRRRAPGGVRGDRNKLLCCCSSAELSPFPLSQASRADISAALADKLTIKYKKKENGRCSVTWRRYQNKLIKICSS